MDTPLTPPVFQILLTLVGGDKVHGYSMIREIAERTEGDEDLRFARYQRLGAVHFGAEIGDDLAQHALGHAGAGALAYIKSRSCGGGEQKAERDRDPGPGLAAAGLQPLRDALSA